MILDKVCVRPKLCGIYRNILFTSEILSENGEMSWTSPDNSKRCEQAAVDYTHARCAKAIKLEKER